MSDTIIFRIAKPSDAGQIALVQYSVRDYNPIGIFSKIGFVFLKTVL